MSIWQWLVVAAVLPGPLPGWSSEVTGCGVTEPASGTYTIVHQGVARMYQLRIPPTYGF